MLIDPNNCCFILIDVQEKLFKKINNYKLIEKEIKKILLVSNLENIPVIVTEQYPKGLGGTVNEIQEEIKKLNKYSKIEKTSFSCWGNQNFRNILRKLKKDNIIIFGIETHICVLQTALELVKESYHAYVVEEAVGSRDSKNKAIAIERMKANGVQVLNLEMLIFELLKDSRHENFKALSNLIK